MKPATYRPHNSEVKIVSLVPGDPFHGYEKILHDKIACRAYELFEADGRVHGHDVEHWLRAEAELLISLQTKIQETEDRIFIGSRVPASSASELRIYAEPLRILIARKSGRTNKDEAGGNATTELLGSVELPAPISLSRSFAELRDGYLTIGFPKAAKQLDKPESARGKMLASAHKQHLRANQMRTLSHAAKEYAGAAREHLGRASRKQERAKEFLATTRVPKIPAIVTPVLEWTEETPHSPVD